MFFEVLKNVLTVVAFLFWLAFAIYGYFGFLKKLSKKHDNTVHKSSLFLLVMILLLQK